jgi:hypothetical protein
MRKIKSLIKRNRLSNNRRGGIEGLPLQLIIVMLIATMGTAIILGWMGNIEGPKVIDDVEVTSGEIVLVNGSTFNGHIAITVTDQDGNPIEGATVVLTGLGVTDRNGKTPHDTTDSKGYANLTGLNISMKNSAVGFITVNVSASGYGENNTARVTVIG